MKNPDEQKDPRLAAAANLADGEPIDWSAASRDARSDADRQFFERLRIVANIAKAHTAPTRTDLLDSIRGTQQPAASGTPDPVSWGPLRILEKIGRGSFGDVYRAWDPRLDRAVALKLLRHRDAPDENVVIEEARLMARVRHPHVVTIYGAERIDGRTGIWMELLSSSVCDEVARLGRLSVCDAASIAAQIAGALNAIHHAGLVHRDVKAQNVLRDVNGNAVLTDFGTGGDVEGGTTPAAGTPLYLAPEVLEGGPATAQSDIYSLGVLLYFLLTGAYPVLGLNTAELRQAHRDRRCVSLSTCRVVPSALRHIVNRALSPDPGSRFPDARRFEEAVTSFLQPQSRSWIVAVALIAITALGMFGAWRAPAAGVGDGTRALVEVASARRNTRYGGVSPDGKFMVCSNAKSRLALCALDSEAVTPILTDPASGFPDGAFAQWSPDGRRIVFMTRKDFRPLQPSMLRLMNVDGGDARDLFTPEAEQWFLRPTGWASRANVIVGDLKDFDETHRIVLLDPVTAEVRVVREFGRDQPVEWIDISADGRFIVHDLRAGSWMRDLFVIDVATGRSWTLASTVSDDIAPLWAPDGSRVYFTSDRSGTFAIWAQRVVDGRPIGEPEKIIETGRDLFMPVAALDDGKRIFYQRRTSGFDGYRANLDLSGATMAVRRLSPRALDEVAAPDWSPDGSRIAYVSSPVRMGNRRGTTRVVVQDVRSGREVDWPVDGPVHQLSLRWWVDGKSLLLNGPGKQPGETVTELRDAESGRVLRELLANRAGGDVAPLPDGSGVIYTTGTTVEERRLSDLQDRTLFRVDVPWRLNQPGGLVVTRDGRKIAVSLFNQDGSAAMARIVSRESGIVTDVEFPVKAIPIAWSDWGQTLVATTWSAEAAFRARTFTFDIVSRATRYLGLTGDQIRQVRIHPGGHEIVFSAGQSRLDFWVLQNPRR